MDEHEDLKNIEKFTDEEKEAAIDRLKALTTRMAESLGALIEAQKAMEPASVPQEPRTPMKAEGGAHEDGVSTEDSESALG